MSTIAPAVSLLLAMVGIPATLAQSGDEAGQVDVLTTGTDRNARLTVPVTLGDHGPFRFMIDTGAQNTVISSALVEQLALPIGAKATVVGVAGRQEVDTVMLDEMALGRRSFYSLLAPVLESGFIGADGIIGLDGLQGQRVLLDFGKGIMAVGDARDLGGNAGFEIVVTARRRSGQLIMTNAMIDGVKVDVVIDTGAESSIGNPALQRALSRRASLEAPEALVSVTGQRIMSDVGFARRLDIADLTFRNVKMNYADSPAFGALGLSQRPALLLGMTQLRLFKRVAIDFSARKVMFDGNW